MFMYCSPLGDVEGARDDLEGDRDDERDSAGDGVGDRDVMLLLDGERVSDE